MAATRRMIRSTSCLSSPIIQSLFSQTSRLMTTSSSLSTAKPHHHHQPEHDFSKPCDFLESWKPLKDPKEAQAKLAMLRRDYAKQMKELRKDYFNEMELQRQEKQRKDEAKKEALRLAKEERKAAKAAMSQAKAAERKVVDEEFRQTLLKERAEKLEYWRMREKQVEEKKKAKKEVLLRKSSIWISENEVEKKALEAFVDNKNLYQFH
ncbi:stress response NST1-like protein [Thalictrum thalictroides]|uniref:Stress response NST1-like protein n=1 Tax=Thalictrum thalictroides TaxID=46969 RepID=A0A7J6UZ79_THATH|nr:stress response NST1-like protein [Thalictrum thalictroides]